MSSPTVERSHITVKCAGSRSAEQNIWKPTSAFTLEKNHTSAHNAVSHVLDPIISGNTWPNSTSPNIQQLQQCPFAIAKTHSSVLCDIMLSSMLTPSWLIFIGPESDHWLCLSLTHSLNSRFVNLIDVTLAFEDANSKLVEVVTVADVDDEDRVGNSLLQIWKLRFGHKVKLLFKLWAQGLVKILRLKFRQDFDAEVWSVFCCWCLVEVMQLNLGQDSKPWFGQDIEVQV